MDGVLLTEHLGAD